MIIDCTLITEENRKDFELVFPLEIELAKNRVAIGAFVLKKRDVHPLMREVLPPRMIRYVWRTENGLLHGLLLIRLITEYSGLICIFQSCLMISDGLQRKN